MFIVHYFWVQNILYIHHIAPLTNFHVNITYVFIIHYKHKIRKKNPEAEIVLTKKYNPCCHTHHRNPKINFQKRYFLQFVSIFSLLCFTTLIYPLLCFAVPDNIFFVSKLVTYLLYQAMKTNNKIFDISQKRRWRKTFKIYVPRF